MIIKIESNDNGSHKNQSISPNDIPDGWIEVPPELDGEFLASGAFCDLTIKDGLLVSIEPLPIPEPAQDNAAKIAVLKHELTATDYQIIKCSEYQLAKMDMPYDLEALHGDRQAIRDEINRLEGNHEAESTGE